MRWRAVRPTVGVAVFAPGGDGRVPADVSGAPNPPPSEYTPPHWTRLTPCASAEHCILIGCARCTACLRFAIPIHMATWYMETGQIADA